MRFEEPFTSAELNETLAFADNPEAHTKATFNAIRTLLAFNNEFVAPVIQGQLSLSPREGAQTTLFFRIHRNVDSLTRLNRLNDFQAIASTSRAIFELFVDMQIINRDLYADAPDRFHTFTNAERLRVAKKIVAYDDDHPGVLTRPTDIERTFIADDGSGIETAAIALWRRPDPQHWTGKNLRARATDVGMEDRYVRYYYQLSQFVHSGSAGFTGMTEKAFHNLVMMSHMLVQRDTTDALSIMAEEFNLRAAIDEFESKLSFLRNVSTFFLRDYYGQLAGVPQRFFVGIDEIDGVVSG